MKHNTVAVKTTWVYVHGERLCQSKKYKGR